MRSKRQGLIAIKHNGYTVLTDCSDANMGEGRCYIGSITQPACLVVSRLTASMPFQITVSARRSQCHPSYPRSLFNSILGIRVLRDVRSVYARYLCHSGVHASAGRGVLVDDAARDSASQPPRTFLTDATYKRESPRTRGSALRDADYAPLHCTSPTFSVSGQPAQSSTMSVPTVWTNYTPPRGQCNYKPSIMSAKCPCLRFMLHPLKVLAPPSLIVRETRTIQSVGANSAQSTSSFECDGCAHHASFHSMENKEEDEIRKRWEQEARDKMQREQRELEERPRKRSREIEYNRADALGSRLNAIEGSMVALDGETTPETGHANCVIAKPKARGSRKSAAPNSMRGSRAKGRITEITGDDEDCIEMD